MMRQLPTVAVYIENLSQNAFGGATDAQSGIPEMRLMPRIKLGLSFSAIWRWRDGIKEPS